MSFCCGVLARLQTLHCPSDPSADAATSLRLACMPPVAGSQLMAAQHAPSANCDVLLTRIALHIGAGALVPHHSTKVQLMPPEPTPLAT